MSYRVAVVGATGNVGREMLTTLAERNFPADEIVALASSASLGKEVSYGEDDILKVQALDAFDLVSDRGQSLPTFLKVTGLIFPALVTVIVPVAVLIAVVYTLNQLNTDSELVSVSASGGSWRILLKPVLLLAFLATVVGAICSLILMFRSAGVARRAWQASR